MSPRSGTFLRWVVWPLAHGLLFLLFLVLTLPTDALRQRLLAEFHARKPFGDTRLEIDSLRSSWLTGVSLRGVRFIGTSPPEEEGKPERTHTVTLERLTVRASLFALLLGRVQIDGDAEGLGGRLRARYGVKGDLREVRAQFEGLGVSQVPMLAGSVGLPLSGTLRGELNLKLPEGRFSRAEGSCSLTLTEFAVGDGKAKVRGTIALPRLEVGEVQLSATLGEGRLKLEKLETAATLDLELSAQGGLRLRDPFPTSLSELQFRIRFAERYTDKNDVTRALFGAPDSKVSGIFDMDPKIRRARRPDGSYHWRVTGPLSNLSFEPAPASGAPFGAGNQASRRQPLGTPAGR